MGILEIIIVITLILLPLGELIRIDIARDITVHPIDISVFLLFITWIVIQIKNKRNILKIPTIKPIMIFSLICLLSLLVNIYWLKPNELIVSTLYLVRWLSFTVIYFAVRDSPAGFKKKTLTRTLIIVGLIITILGFMQFFFYPSLMDKTAYQWDKHIFRMFSVFLDPNYTGSFLVLYLLFLCAVVGENFVNKKSKTAIRFMIIASITLIAVYLTFSRSAMLMLLAGSTTFLTIIDKKMYIFILLFITIVFILASSPNFYVENINLFRINSTMDRIKSAKISLQIIGENPILGVGFNAYRYAQIKYNHRTPEKFSSHANAGTDNSFLFVITTTGVIGFLFYIYLWLQLLREAYRKSKKENSFYAACVLSSALGLSVNALFINSLFFAPVMIWMWVILGINRSK